jgi:hypothetical protein
MLKKKSINIIFALVFIVLITGYTAHFKAVGSSVYGDGIYYYTYLRSAVIDKDLEFTNEFLDFNQSLLKTNLDRVVNKFSPGPAFLWLPFFLLAHILSLLFNFPLNGYSFFYQFLVGIGGLVYGSLGLLFSFKTASFFYSQKKSLIAALFICFASNLFFYISLDTVNSHAVSFFASSLFLYLFFKNKSSLGKLKYPLLGFLTGLLASIRLQDAVLSLTVFLKEKNIKKKAVFTFFLLIGIIPQVLLWHWFFGQVKNPYLALGGRFNFLNFNFLKVLFSLKNGLFFYSPILVFSFIGNLYLFKKDKKFALAYFLIFFLQLFIISSWHVWWGGASYGGRMFISLAPFHVLGLTAFLENIGRNMRKYFYILQTGLVILNMANIYLFLLAN